MGTIPPVPMLRPHYIQYGPPMGECAYCGRRYNVPVGATCKGCGAPTEDVPSVVLGVRPDPQIVRLANDRIWTREQIEEFLHYWDGLLTEPQNIDGKRFPDLANRDLITNMCGEPLKVRTKRPAPMRPTIPVRKKGFWAWLTGQYEWQEAVESKESI